MAITTSPDNIPSPTSGDPYNYVVDMAALADGTQDALTQKANMGVGTSTQRVTALSKFPDGALWYDTTTDSEWRRVAGAWVAQGVWTSWTPVLSAPGWTVGTGGLIIGGYKEENGVVTMWGRVTFGTGFVGGTGSPNIAPPRGAVGFVNAINIFVRKPFGWTGTMRGHIIGSSMNIFIAGIDGSARNWTATDPFTVASGDFLEFGGTYSAA